MTDSEMIIKQLLKIEKLKKKLKRNREVRKELHGLFYSIGAPLNDNILRMDKAQLTWCMKVYKKIEEIKGL